jgi:hypothetical protein
MVRLWKVLWLWCRFSVAGLAAVLAGAWALEAVGADSLMTAFLVLGLASVFPVSLAVADNVVPRAHHRVWPSVSCPHCGAPASCPHCGTPFGPGPGPKPDPDLWTLPGRE